jgi:hypothetical protein
MKKTLSIIIALVMIIACVASLAVSVSAEDTANREFTVYKVSTAPTIDGTIADGEYPLVTSWPDDTAMVSRGDYVKNIQAFFYMCYDADYLYYAVKTECDAPHVAMMDNTNQHYIFNAHVLMSLIIPDDPTNGNYPDETATWSDLYNGGYCYEWSMIYTSEAVTGVHEANVPFATDHFSNLIASGNATYATNSDGSWDTYEIRIPWAAMYSTQQPTALTGTEGTVFGMDFTLGLTNINEDADVIAAGGYDGTDGVYKGNYLYLAGCYSVAGAKSLKGCAVMTLGGEYTGVITDESSAEATSSEATSTEASTETSENGTPSTGDTGIIALAIISVIALAGAVVIKRK